jgi:hypothetical protein
MQFRLHSDYKESDYVSWKTKRIWDIMLKNIAVSAIFNEYGWVTGMHIGYTKVYYAKWQLVKSVIRLVVWLIGNSYFARFVIQHANPMSVARPHIISVC